MKIFNLVIILFFCSYTFAQKLNQHVNPFIGTGGHGHTFPGATVPYGMVQLSPDTRIDGSWDGCSGYHYDDKVIYGFSHTHLNGTGCSDFGDIMLMPTMGKSTFDNKFYSSPFSHINEKASAGFYSVKLDKHNIDVRLTSTTRVGFHEYKFNNSGLAHIILDLNHRDKLLYGEIKIIDNKTIEILRRSEAWARDQYVFARIEFNTPMVFNGIGNKINNKDLISGTIVALQASKEVKTGDKILVKVALSPTSYEGAKLNSSEIQNWNFEQVKSDAEKLWNSELSKIKIEETNKDKLAIFYTALYHTMIQPNIAEDLDGKYRGRDNKIHIADTFDYYSVFSLWDTFRAAHPLYTLIDKKRTADYINTFIAQYEQGGRLPVWELASNETDCMIGYHSVSVIADAMAKNIGGFNYEKAFEAAKHSAMLDHLGLDAYKKQGYISIDDEHENVSKTLEYAYDDWCIAQMALQLNKQEDFNYFMKRSQNWKNIFDWDTGFMRPKKNGGWDKPFDPKEINNNFTEGNSWQYSFFVPQDIEGLIEAHGGKVKFEAKLDLLFSEESKTTGREQADVTGLIGQYAHGNEPSHHMAYLYNHVDKPEKTEKTVHFILDEFYKNTPDGLIGNEDCGQMSAWYVLSSIGIYQITPGKTSWDKVKPYYKSGKIKMENGKTLAFNPNKTINEFDFYTKIEKPTTELLYWYTINTVPVIVTKGKTFKENQLIEIQHINSTKKQFKGSGIYYRIANKDSDFKLYTNPFEINETSTIEAYYTDSIDSNSKGKSAIISATFYKKPNNYTIDLKSTYNPQYHAGGSDGLLDGIKGNKNWRKGDWQGYQSQDFECIIDLHAVKLLNKLSANFLQHTRSWIIMPTQVEFYISNDAINYELVEICKHNVDPKNYEEEIIYNFETKAKLKAARYVKVKAKNFGKLPEWHQGAGNDAFIFIDEIEVK